jgi:hypothetical protein
MLVGGTRMLTWASCRAAWPSCAGRPCFQHKLSQLWPEVTMAWNANDASRRAESWTRRPAWATTTRCRPTRCRSCQRGSTACGVLRRHTVLDGRHPMPWGVKRRPGVLGSQTGRAERSPQRSPRLGQRRMPGRGFADQLVTFLVPVSQASCRIVPTCAHITRARSSFARALQALRACHSQFHRPLCWPTPHVKTGRSGGHTGRRS